MMLISRFLASKWVTVVLIMICAAGAAYVTYVIGENRRLDMQNTTLQNSRDLYKDEIVRLNHQIQRISEAEEAAKLKLSDNQRVLQDLEDDDKKTLSTMLPIPLVDRMCELNQLDRENCS